MPLLCNAPIIQVPFEVDQLPPHVFVTLLQRKGTLRVTFRGYRLPDMKMQSQFIRFSNEWVAAFILHSMNPIWQANEPQH